MTTATELSRKHCVACEGKTERLPPDQVQSLLKQVPNWKLVSDGATVGSEDSTHPTKAGRIRREWRVKDFLTALDFFRRVGEIAEAEDHHPDLHLVGYRNVTIEIWTHAVNGLTENDFILAARIDLLPVELKS